MAGMRDVNWEELKPLLCANREGEHLDEVHARGRLPTGCVIGTVILCVVLSACGTSNVVAPVGRASIRDAVAASSQGVYRVLEGDSLYSVAWRYALDYRDLARWNAIAEPFTIYPGQQLRVSRPAVLPTMPRATVAPRPARQASEVPLRSEKKNTVARTSPSRPAPKTKSAAKRAPPAKPTTRAPVQRTKKSNAQQVVKKWRWPVRGKIIGRFGSAGGKGIDIAGSRGTVIKAAAPGHVVYSGSGLRGYGRLIIVKHNKRYLSAYAHNERLHVKEGDTVKGGQRIAEMGDSDAKSVRLHFEIRRDGEPVNPTRFLPR